MTSSIILANERVVVGITDANLLTRKEHKDKIQSYEIRERNTQHFMKLINPNLVYKTHKIIEPGGDAVIDPNIDILVFTEESKSGYEYVKKGRSEKGLPPLEPFVIPLLSYRMLDENNQYVRISSTYLRSRIKE